MKKIILIATFIAMTMFGQVLNTDHDKDLIFREVFQDEQTLRKNLGTPTDITSYNPAVFNGTSSKITYPISLNGTYSVRVKCVPNTTVNQFIFDTRGTLGYFYLKHDDKTLNNSSGT